MPALTLAQLQSALGTPASSHGGTSFIEPGMAFTSALNEVGPRVYAMGQWRDLLDERTYAGSEGYFALDRDVEAVLSAVVNDRPVRTRSQFHDKIMLGNTPFLPDRYGLVDLGMVPVLREFATIQGVSTTSEVDPVTTLHLSLPNGLPVSASMVGTGDILIQGFDSSERPVSGTLQGTTEMTIVFPGDGVIGLQSILGVNLPVSADLSTDISDPATKVATVMSGTDAVRYRRYRIGGSRDSTFIHVLVKLGWTNVCVPNDVVRLGNLAVWKHALLAKVQEDNADIERASYYWERCKELLNEEKEAHRGAAIPSLNIEFNHGSGFPIHNNY